MKRILVIGFVLISLIETSCKKATIPGAVSVKLSATTFYKNGSEETKFERSGNLEKTSYAQLVNDGSGVKYLLNLGAFGNAPNLSAFGIHFLFNQQTTPAGIAGTYTFPRDQLLVKGSLRNEVTQTVTETINYPTRGSITVSYDPGNNKINGTINDLEFSIVPNDPYNRYRVTIKGSFNNIPVH